MLPKPVPPPSLTEEIETQRAINQRLYQHSLKLDVSEVNSDTLIAIVRALALGHACVARLERERRALTGGDADPDRANVAAAFDELVQLMREEA